MDLGSGLDEILQVGASKEVSKGNKLAMTFILDIDDTPSVLTASDLFASNKDRLLRPNYSEGDDALIQC
jgi:hypothetical protein